MICPRHTANAFSTSPLASYRFLAGACVESLLSDKWAPWARAQVMPSGAVLMLALLHPLTVGPDVPAAASTALENLRGGSGGTSPAPAPGFRTKPPAPTPWADRSSTVFAAERQIEAARAPSQWVAL